MKITQKKENTKIGKTIKGVVFSDKMDKTVVVSVSRLVKHPKYGKFYKINKKYKAHDEKNEYKTGDKIEITETKPISKGKYFKVINKKLSPEINSSKVEK